MAAVTLLAIVSFIFLPAVIDLIGGGGGAGGQITTIAESRRFGKITEFELERLRNNQEALRRFLVVLYQNLADPNDVERMHALAPLEAYIRQVMLTQAPERLVDMWLVTQCVREEGLSPNWEDVSNLLRELTGGYLSDAIYDETRQAIGMSHQAVEQLLARQIQWQQALMRFDLSVGAISPATRWDWYQRLYRNVTVEVAAVPIDAFIGQVTEPTERQLTAFFEQHKGKRYSPMFADSGFIMPTELAFQYVIAEPTQQLLDSITEEEILAFYEEHKDELFRRSVTPMPELPQLPGMMPGLPSGAFPFPTPGRSVTPTMPVLSEDAPETNTPNLPDLPGVDWGTLLETTPNEAERTEPLISEGTVEDTTPETVQEDAVENEPAPAEPVSSEEVTGEADEFSEEASVMPGVMTRLVSYQTTDEAEMAVSVVPLAEVSEPTTGETVSQGTFEQTLDGLASVLEDSEVVDLSVLYIPFDEVKDRIRATLAQEKATEALPIIQAEMRNYARSYNEHFEQNRPIPPMPDLTGFVAELGLELVTVPMGNIFAARQTELARRGLQELQHLVQKFRRMPMMFEGEIFWGSSGQVLYWVTEEKHELRPDRLDQVREVVLKRWKEVEARALAMKRAEELANEARASDNSLAEVFAGRSDVPVVDTEPFTWKTYGALHPSMAVMYRVPPQLGEVRESGVVVGDANFDNQWIVAPGWDFMETVYSLRVGETGVVFNQPQTVAYVVRLTSSSPSAEVLWEQFQTTNVRIYFPAGVPEMMEASFEAWMDEIRNKTGFRWINRPDARGSEWFDEEF